MSTTTQNTNRTTHLLALMKKGDDAFNVRDFATTKALHHPEMIAHVMGSTARRCRKLSTRKAGVLQLYYRVVEVQITDRTIQLENVMQEFINKYREAISGTLSGFDRLVFRGSLRRLNFGCWDPNLQSRVVRGMEQYLWLNHILFK